MQAQRGAGQEGCTTPIFRAVQVDVGVLVVGGGLQGLVALRALAEAGYDCLLVTAGDLGAGQTLHSHGLLDSGTGLVTGETRREVHEHVLPELRRLSVPVATPPSFLALPAPAVEALAPAWAAHDHDPEPVNALVPGLALPPGVHRVQAHHVDKPVLVRALTNGLRDRVVKGTVLRSGSGFELVLPDGRALDVHPQAVVVAAGCGTHRLLSDALRIQAPVLDRLGHVRTHMLCLRAPAGVLPAVGTVLTPGLVVVAHQDRDGAGRWYVTPGPAGVQPDRAADVPDDAHAEVQPDLVDAAVTGLRQLIPVLADPDPPVEVTVFAGWKQDVDGQMTRRLVAVVDTDPLVLVAVPSVFAGAWANAREVVEHVRAHLPTQGRRSHLLDGLPPVELGVEDERRDGVEWSRWRDVART